MRSFARPLAKAVAPSGAEPTRASSDAASPQAIDAPQAVARHDIRHVPLAAAAGADEPACVASAAIHRRPDMRSAKPSYGPLIQAYARPGTRLGSQPESFAADRAAAAPSMANRGGLPAPLKTNVEALSGITMDQVRVHYNSPQPARLFAHAFAAGSDIHLAPGQDRHLGHEAWHVVQQKQRRVRLQLRSLGVAINDSPALEAEADRMGRRLQAGPVAQPDSAAPPVEAATTAAPVVQRIVTIGGALLRRANELPHFAELTEEQQAAVAQMVDDRAAIYAYPNLLALFQHVVLGDANSAPVVTQIAASTITEARKKKRARTYDMATVPESSLSKNEAFHSIPAEQLYTLEGKRGWVRNPHTKEYERRRSKSEKPLVGEELLEYVDPKNKKKENYGYRVCDQLRFTRTDPSSNAGLSRTGASGKKVTYKDKRGGYIGMKKFPGMNNNKRIQKFKRTRDNKTFVIGHSVAVKNMSMAKDKYGLNSDEQPKMFVPEDDVVGEHIKNPFLEQETNPYIWENEYSANPDKVYAGVPIPTHTRATMFKADGKTPEFSVRVVNDGSVDYAAEREKENLALQKQTGKKTAKYTYGDLVVKNNSVPFKKAKYYDYESTPPMSPISDPPQTPYFMPEFLEEQTVSTISELTPGTTHQEGGKDFQVGWSMGQTGGKFSYKIDRTNFHQSSASDVQDVTNHLESQKSAVSSDAMQDDPTTVSTTAPTSLSTQQDPVSFDDFDFLLNDDERLAMDQIIANFFEEMAEQARLEQYRAQTKHRQKGLVHTGQQLSGAVPLTSREGLKGDLGNLQQAIEAIGQVDPTDLGAGQLLNLHFATIRHIFDQIEPHLQRPITASGGDPLGATGSRLPVLAQFFAECGQMAAHNALALANWPTNATYNDLLTAMQDQGPLRQLGNFQDWIHEDALRDVVAGGGRQDIPVVGNIDQVENMMNQADIDLQTDLGVEDNVLAELRSLRDFRSGATSVINLVVNTEGQNIQEAGYHWITVRVERQQDGQLRVFYADSYQEESDYSGLFARLKQMLTAV